MKRKTIKYSVAVLVVVLTGIQFIRPEKNVGNADGPEDITHYVPVPADVKVILQRSCYDCHSNHTRYPWYFNINPVAWFMSQHIQQGKKELNFSDVSGMSERLLSHKLKSIAEQVQGRHMPISSYTLIHTDAKLNNNEINIINIWTAMASQHIVTHK